MATKLDDAIIEVKIVTDGALGDLRKLRTERERIEKPSGFLFAALERKLKERQKKQKAESEKKSGLAQEFGVEVVAGTKLGRRFVGLARGGLSGLAIFKIIQIILPMVSAAIEEGLKGSGFIGEFFAELIDDAIDGIAKKLTILEKTIIAAFGAAGDTVGLARAELRLGGTPTAVDRNFKRFHEIRQKETTLESRISQQKNRQFARDLVRLTRKGIGR